MAYLIVLAGAAVIALLVWRAMNAERATVSGNNPRPTSTPPSPPRATGPDDDPEFLRSLDESLRKRDDPPAAG